MTIRREFLVDTKTDAQRVFRTLPDVLAYLEGQGVSESDVIFDYSNEYRVTVEVPQWQSERDAYCAAKLAWCNRYGCE